MAPSTQERRLSRLRKDLARRLVTLNLAIAMMRKGTRYQEEDWLVIKLAAEDLMEKLAVLEEAKEQC